MADSIAEADSPPRNAGQKCDVKTPWAKNGESDDDMSQEIDAAQKAIVSPCATTLKQVRNTNTASPHRMDEVVSQLGMESRAL